MDKQFSLYIVPTPIGHIKDITFRAVEILKQVDIIACEDSRVTQKLLNHYDIKTKCISYHKFNEKERCSIILNLLSEGKQVALVSDAGTPLICDPGGILVDTLRKNNVKITSLPGACAVSTFLSQVPRKDEEYIFVGFLPKSESQIQKVFQHYKNANVVFYDSPNRILKTLELIKSFRPEAKIALGRELTKVFEEIVIDDIQNVINHFGDIKGEIVAMVYAKKVDNSEVNLEEKIEKLSKKGFKSKEIATILSELYDINKKEVYNMTLKFM